MILHLRPVGPGEATQAVEGVPFKGSALAVVPLFQELAPVVVAAMTIKNFSARDIKKEP